MICDHQKISPFLDYGLMKIKKCADCHLVFMDYAPAQTSAPELYAGYYKSGSASRFNFRVELLVRFFRLARARHIARLFGRGRSILDIGSGRGWVLYFLKKYFAYNRAVGIQISAPARNFARQKFGLEIYDRDFLDLDFGAEKFDVISMLHVLEHVDNPELYIKKIADTLTADGGFFVEVPNLRAWSRSLTGQYWLSWDPQYHKTFFDVDSLVSLLTKHGFKIRQVSTFSWEYSIFSSAQSLASAWTKSEHIFFRLLQGEKFSLQQTLIGTLSFLLMLIPGLLINLALFFSRRGEVLRIVANK